MNPIVNIAHVPTEQETDGGQYSSSWKVLTPTMRERGGRLGVNQTVLPPGNTSCPFHSHLLEDEVFFVQSGRGVLRYGEELFEIGPGDCISCPAGTGVAHQIANPYDEDLVYLAIGPHEPHEVCVYPDSGKVFIRATKQVGFVQVAPYMAGEPVPARIFELIGAREP